MHEFHKIVEEVRKLPIREKVRLIEVIARDLELKLQTRNSGHESLWGAFKHFGPGPSEEDIAAVRRAVWKQFPREDI